MFRSFSYQTASRGHLLQVSGHTFWAKNELRQSRLEQDLRSLHNLVLLLVVVVVSSGVTSATAARRHFFYRILWSTFAKGREDLLTHKSCPEFSSSLQAEPWRPSSSCLDYCWLRSKGFPWCLPLCCWSIACLVEGIGSCLWCSWGCCLQLRACCLWKETETESILVQDCHFKV